MAKIARKLMAHFIDTATTGTPSYERLGTDLEEFTTEMGAQVDSTKNILGETSTKVSSYEKTASVEPFNADQDSALFTRLQDIIDAEKTLDELKTTVVEVHLWDEDETTSGTYVAYKEDAIIEVVSYGGDATGYQIPFNIHLTGGRVKGTFVLSTKTFTADE